MDGTSVSIRNVTVTHNQADYGEARVGRGINMDFSCANDSLALCPVAGGGIYVEQDGFTGLLSDGPGGVYITDSLIAFNTAVSGACPQ